MTLSSPSVPERKSAGPVLDCGAITPAETVPGSLGSTSGSEDSHSWAVEVDAAVALGAAVGDVGAAAAFDQVGAAAAVEGLVVRGPDDVVVERGPDHRLEAAEARLGRERFVDPASGWRQAVVREVVAEVDVDAAADVGSGSRRRRRRSPDSGSPGSRRSRS